MEQIRQIFSVLSKVEIIIDQEKKRRNKDASSEASARSVNKKPAAKKPAGSREQSGAKKTNGAKTHPANKPRPAGQGHPANKQHPAGQSRPVNKSHPAGQGQPVKRRRKKKRSLTPVLVVLVVLLVAAIAAAAGIGVYAMRYSNYDKILPNVYVAGVDVGGMTKEEAKAAIESALSGTEQQKVNVILPDQVLTFQPEQDTVLIDVDAAVDEAYAYGRNSKNAFAMSRAIKAAQRRKNDIDISTAVEIDTVYIRELIDTTAANVSTELVESDVQADTANHTITVTIGTPGKKLDTETLYTLVTNAFSAGDYSDINFDYTMTYPATVALDRLYEQMTTEPVDAYYDAATGEVVAEIAGYVPSVELSEANEQLALAASGDQLVFTFDETPAAMTKAALEPMLFRDTLYSHGTVYASNYNRTENLRLACKAINGTVLQPGEVFSFNEVVGERTAEKGYKEGIIYTGGNSEPALGGGICQVASTIYYCCMYADLEIVHREPHMFTVDYVPGGLDATVYWGSVDFQFRNSTDYPLRIDAYLYNGRVYIDLIGTDVNNYTVEIKSELVSTTPFQTIEREGSGEGQSGYTGKTYAITRYVYDSNGTLIRTDSTADLDALGGLGTSVHSKRDKIVYISKEEPSPSPSVSPSPSTEPTTPPTTEPTAPPTTEPTTPPTTAPTTPEPTTAPPAPTLDPGSGDE